MTTVAERVVRALRDEVVHAHQIALDSGDIGKMATRLYKTSATVGNYYSSRFNGTFDPTRTRAYVNRMAKSQMKSTALDGLGSASQATNFGTREFAKQNPRADWVLTWRHFPSARSREAHSNAAGLEIPFGDDFGVIPPMGAPFCGCIAELSIARATPR